MCEKYHSTVSRAHGAQKSNGAAPVARKEQFIIFLEILHSFGEITFIKERIFIKNYKSCINKDFFPQELKFFLQIQLMASLVRGERYWAAIFFSVGALVMCLVRWDLF